MSKVEKNAALLLAFGGAESTDVIEPFLKNILRGRTVSPELIERTKERYQLIGGKSPLLDITNRQAAAIEEHIRKAGSDMKVYVGMRYWQPYIKDTLEKMLEDGVTGIAAVVMAPFTSPVATGGYEKAISEAIKKLGAWDLRVVYVGNWHIHPVFVDIVVENLKEALKEFEDPEDALVIFSNHSLPKEALEGDAYEMKIHQAMDEILKRLPVDYRVGYQSQGGGNLEWLGPKVEDVIEEAKTMGKKGVVVVPLGFVSDHVETLYDIDILFKEHAEKLGLKFTRTPSLNDTPQFTELLADLLRKLSVSL